MLERLGRWTKRIRQKKNAGPADWSAGLRFVNRPRFFARDLPEGNSCNDNLRGARATAAAGVAEAHVAAAAALAATFEAIAAGLEHLAALGVAAGAGDAATFLRVLALAVAAAEVDVANLDAIPGAAARAGAVAQGLTKALQRAAGDGVAAVAMRRPPLHFSNFSSHRGTTHTFCAGAVVGALDGKAGAAPVAKAPRRSMTALDISSTPFGVRGPPGRRSTRPIRCT
ncbi:MAG: hypothetical protein DME65_13300 [Verrucomicrobia bacterium]|nr:MAG: hypothetical protein DME65_13300 [Verrucomicrobiota bacterium]